MTDSELLKAFIKASGLTMDFISHSLGVSKKRLQNKIDGKVEFKADELCVMIRLLNLSERQTMNIFFSGFSEG